MSNAALKPVPRIEFLLDAAHRDYSMLRERREALMRCGISGEHLPDDPALMAFALLGDHDRTPLADGLNAHWQALRSKGLARGAIDDAPTPELRLLSHALQFTDAIEDVWQRLQGAMQTPEPPNWMFRCATRVQGLWGQPARLHFSAQDVAYVLISPDKLFGMHPAMLAADMSGHCVGSFVFPVDTGLITFTIQQRSGEVFRHVVHSLVEEMA